MNKDKTVIAESFYKMEAQAKAYWQALKEKPVVLVGTATCGRAAGAMEVVDAFRDEFARRGLDAQVCEVGCMGHCYAEPLVVIYKPGMPAFCYGYVTEGMVKRLVADFILGDDPCVEFALGALEENDYVPSFADFPRFQFEKKIILENCGFIDPEDINHYVANGGYSGLAKALQMEPKQVIGEVKVSKLRGRGGAGFPTGQKWETCRSSPGMPKYVICNADEGDPGAFMDRAILESNPHSVIEGLIIAGYAVGAFEGYIYGRAEYPLAVKRVKVALEQARESGLLGKGKFILGSDFSFDIQLFQGSGAFVCGEETALITSMEGNPGIPRHRPPFPATVGLYARPTVVDNVKTLAYVPHIINKGAQWFRSIGTSNSPGTAVFTLAGKIMNTGLAEVPMGTTLRQLIFEVGGGITGGKHFKAVQIGGPSGGCLPESALDLPVDFDSLNESGAIMGSGGMVIMDEDDCMVEIARFFLDFTQKESCGKCTLCRLGTKHMLAILESITIGQGKPEDVELLIDLAEDVRAGSLCRLGKTAPNPVLSTIRYFRNEYEAHLKERRCPALMCKKLVAYYILPEKCERSCDACVGSCPTEAVYTTPDRIKAIEQEKCVKCGSCLEACPPQYKAVIKLSPPELVTEMVKSNNNLLLIEEEV